MWGFINCIDIINIDLSININEYDKILRVYVFMPIMKIYCQSNYENNININIVPNYIDKVKFLREGVM